jgi:hypothetical protein
MTKILAIDPATVTGFAVGQTDGEPVWGTRSFRHGQSNGEIISMFRFWLNGAIQQEYPKIVCFEAPYIARPGPQRKGGPPPQNAATLRRLLGIVGQIEATCAELSIECYETPTQEFTKFFTGRGRWPGGSAAKKAQTILACKRLGWLDVSADEADALSLFCYAESIIDPVAAARRKAKAGLELPLHEAQDDGRSVKSAAGGQIPAAPETRIDEETSDGSRQQSFTIF